MNLGYSFGTTSNIFTIHKIGPNNGDTCRKGPRFRGDLPSIEEFVLVFANF